jgi:hypothetical protein
LPAQGIRLTAGQDLDFAFAETHDYLTREGCAVAIVSAQRVGVDRLKAWSPQRYGTLSATVGNEDPNGGGKLDECGGAPACPGDALSWDIRTQVSKALKENAGDNKPLPGLKVKKVIALGESQPASRLTLYYNAIQPNYGFFDGFVFLDLAGQLRSDLTVPAISVNSEVIAAMFPPTTRPATPHCSARSTRGWFSTQRSMRSTSGSGPARQRHPPACSSAMAAEKSNVAR